MNKKVIVFCVCATMLVLLTSLSPVLATTDEKSVTTHNTLVTIQVNKFIGRQPEQLQTQVTPAEAEQIKQYLTALHEALEKNDKDSISHYESLLNEKGIFGKGYQKFTTQDEASTLLKKVCVPQRLLRLVDENISNTICYFNAIGEGGILFPFALSFLQAITKIINNETNPFTKFILFLVFLPLLVTVMFLTDLIPFRIAMPNGALVMTNGSISCLGTNGFQRVVLDNESYGVNISWFTGLTVSILPINNHKPFVFMSGVALKVEGQPV